MHTTVIYFPFSWRCTKLKLWLQSDVVKKTIAHPLGFATASNDGYSMSNEINLNRITLAWFSERSKSGLGMALCFRQLIRTWNASRSSYMGQLIEVKSVSSRGQYCCLVLLDWLSWKVETLRAVARMVLFAFGPLVIDSTGFNCLFDDTPYLFRRRW